MCQRLRSLRVGDTKIVTHPSALRNFRLMMLRSSAIGNILSQPPSPKRTVGPLFSYAAAKVHDYR